MADAKTVLITGASSGTGAAAVKHFAANGWNVAATMRNTDSAPHPGDDRVLVTRLDVQELSTIDNAIAEAIDRFGSIDVVVNNAGYAQYGVFEALSPADVQRQLDVNLLGPMAVIRSALPHLRAAGHGVVVNVSSGAGLYGLPMASAYCASKFALEGFSEALAYELRGIGIAVKLVIPHGGVADTRFAEGSAMASIPDEYAAYATATWTAAAQQPAPVPIPAAAVASAVYTAANDTTATLRYLVGNDTRGLVKALDLPLPQRETRLRDLLGG